MKNRHLYFLSLFAIYILILIPSLYTPFHSDDYSYFLKGVSIDKTISHYMDWSGRLITDFTSSLLLNYLPYYLYEAINAFVFLAMCFLVSIIPILIKKRDNNSKPKPSSLVLWLVFFIYWISNPSLGQTSFWIVGSTNYLWTILWASVYICYLLYLINWCTKKTVIHYAFLTLFGLLAGCSNENTGVSVVVFNLVLLFFEKDNRRLVSFGLGSSIIGSLILILAPGNSIRKLWFPDWYSKSTFDQITIHIFERMPGALSAYLHAYIILALLFLILFFNKKITNKKNIYVACSFICISFFANIILLKAPYIGGRNLNTGLFFLLPAIAIIFSELFKLTGSIKKLTTYGILLYCVIFFTPSYFAFTYMMTQTTLQQKIHNKIIALEKSKGNSSIELPDWHFTYLLKSTDSFDGFKSGSMPIYYGVDNITWNPVYFNYAILETTVPTAVNRKIGQDITLLSLYSYKNILMKNKVTFEFDKPLSDNAPNDSIIHIKLLTNKGKEDIVTIPLGVQSKINGKYYIEIDSSPFDIRDITYIYFDVLTPIDNVVIRSYKVSLAGLKIN